LWRINLIFLTLLLCPHFSLSFFSSPPDKKNKMAQAQPALRIALDWTPCSNHVGFFVARALGFIPSGTQLLSPEAGGYTSSPARDVLEGRADLCIAPTETVIAYASPQDASSGAKPPQLIAVAALLQKDTSAIAVLESSGITSPKELDGKLYASYNARYEGSIVKSLVQSAGGQGTLRESFPPRLDCYDHVLSGAADATWIFLPHEGVKAQQQGIGLRTFALGDFGIPYGYSPLLLASPELLAGARGAEVKALLAGVARGYQHAAEHPAEAAQLLAQNSGHASLADAAFVEASVAAAAPAFLSASGAWGSMDKAVWSAFLEFLEGKGLLVGRDGKPLPAELTPKVEALFSNDFLPAGVAQ